MLTNWSTIKLCINKLKIFFDLEINLLFYCKLKVFYFVTKVIKCELEFLYFLDIF